MNRKLIAAACAVALITLGACGDDDDATSGDDTTTTVEEASGPQTVEVYVDSKLAGGASAYLGYFPNEVTLHPGDTVNFESVFTGEPHTVTFGTLVDEGLAKSDPQADEEPPELAKIPVLLPEGPGDAIQAAAQPCFLATEDPPASDACSKDQQVQPDFDGKHTYFNSGFLGDGDAFEVKLADDLEPGTYSYFCTLHRGGMTGKITVVAEDARAQTAEEVEVAGGEAIAAAEAKVKPIIDAVKAGTLPPFLPTAAPGVVIAGGGSPDVFEAVPTLFGPDATSIKTGESVTWSVVGPHTITFGASEALRTFIAKAPDGAVHLNPDSFAPAGGPGQPPPDPNAAPPADDAPPVPIDGGSYDGTGVKSSGLILSFPPPLYTYKVTFTKAGSYPYICTIHPDMKGVVNVA